MYRVRHFIKTRKKIIHRLFLTIAYGIIFIALLSTGFRALTPMAVRYQPNVEQLLSQALGRIVHIQDLEVSWYWFEPLLKAHHVVVDGEKKPILAIQQLQVGINLWKSLWYWRFQPGLLWIEGTEVNIQETPEAWVVNGLRFDKISAPIQDLETLSVILEQKKCHLKNINVTLSLLSKTLEFHNLQATLINRLGEHRLRGEVLLVGDKSNVIDFGAEIVLTPQISGHVYVGVDDFNFQPWMSFMPLPKVQFKSIQGKLELWGEVFNGKLASVQTLFDLKSVRWLDLTLNKTAFLPRLTGRARFEYLYPGFKLTVNPLQVTDIKGKWPLTEMVLKAVPEQEDYLLSIQTLPIERVLKLPIRTSLDFLPPHLKGTLKSFLLAQHLGETKVLTGFEEVSFQPKDKWPGVAHLSGAFVIEKQRGRLAINSQNLMLQFQKYPALDFPIFNLALTWEKPNPELPPAVELASFSLSHPYLKLNAEGTLSSQHLIDVKAQFEAQEVTYWLTYLPRTYLKPKLYRWLSEDVRQIGSWNGKVKLNGALKDFPFDKGPGVFRIDSTLSQTDLIFAPHWPMAKAIEGRLMLDKRLLTAEVNHARIKNAPIEQVQLVVNDLGLDKEHLRLHGIVHANTAVAWPVLLHSPIGKGQDFLSHLHWQGPMDLDLRLDAALYPGNDAILIQGDVNLKKDALTINSQVLQLNFEDLTGHLLFDEHGFLNSQLLATIWGQTLPLQWMTNKTLPRQATINIKVKTTPQLMFQALKIEPLAGLNGKTTVKVKYTLPFDRTLPQVLTLHSQLKGLKINLPHVVSKGAADTLPFESTIQVYTDEPPTLALHYGELATVDFVQGVWGIHTHFPTFTADLHYNPLVTLLSGEIEQLTLKKEAMGSTEVMHPTHFPAVDLTIKKLTYETLDLGSLTLKTKNIKAGVEIDPWTLSTSVYTLTGSALWTENKKEQHSQVKCYLKTPNVRDLLERWEFSPFLEVGKAEMMVDVNWPAGLNQFSLVDAEGDIHLRIKQGRTTNFSPETESKLGLARLFSVLSLRTIPRRLKLDFSDLSHDGYSFDDFDGQFKLHHGILAAESVAMDGPAAAANITGEANVVKQIFDLTIQVIPHITASLPVVAATIVGGPIAGPVVGVATWAAGKLLSKGVQKITSYTYRVTGPFADPKMEALKIKSRS